MTPNVPNIIAHEIIGNNIIRLRNQMKISQSTFASMVGLNRSYLSNLERGLINPSIDTLIKIADGLDVPLTCLFEGLEECVPRKLPEVYYQYGSTKIPSHHE